jgi:hypothetical protein
MSLEALKAHLFETLEGVKNNNDPMADQSEKVSTQEAKCIVNIANSIIEIYKTQVDALKTLSHSENYRYQGGVMSDMGVLPNSETKQLGGD